MKKLARFEVGTLVSHKRYGYRGAIADWDPECRADEAWYQSNATQPPREQPWYHVLVHGSDHTTYVAQSNLEVYKGGEQVANPLTRQYFQCFHEGRYHLKVSHSKEAGR